MSALLVFGMLVGKPHSKSHDRGGAYVLFVFFPPELLGLLTTPGADAKSGFVFCSECDDFIFDDTIDELYLSTVVSVEERNTKFQGTF